MIRSLVLPAVCLVLCCPQVLADVEGGDPKEWLQDLESEEFAVRERAGGKLAKWAEESPDEARELFLGHFRSHEDPEVRMRCSELLRNSVLTEYRGHGKGFVGIAMQEIGIEGGGFGVQISRVEPDTPAAKSGLRVGDVIEALDGRSWDVPGADLRFKAEVMSRRPGDKVTLRIRRRGEAQPVDVELELAERPPGLDALWPQFRIDPEIARRELEERKKREEDAFFQHWLDRRLEGKQKGVPETAPK
jgi:hypothetical protein